MNLVWASNIEIEPQEVMIASWQWRSLKEFSERLRTVVAGLYKWGPLRSSLTAPFSSEENCFMIAWIQESDERNTVYDDRRPTLLCQMLHGRR